jgi:hypothetical protein
MAACVPISSGFTDPPSSLGRFTMRELEHLLLLELGQSETAKSEIAQYLWPWAPFEYLARRSGKQQLIVDEIPVADLLPHIPYLLEYCRHLIDTACSPARAQEAAKKAAVFTARLLDVLLFPGVQNRLGGQQQLQPTIELLQVAVPAFQQRAAPSSSGLHAEDSADNQQPAAAASAAATASTAAAGYGSSLEVVDTPFACPAAASGQSSAPAASAAAAPRPAAAGATGMHLAALLTAIAPYIDQPGSPLPPNFNSLLAQWGRLVYGEVADPCEIQVSALILYHWRTLLRYLRLCLQGAQGTLGSSTGPMLVSTAVGHLQGLLHLLHHDALRALFTAQQYRRVTDRLGALKTLLQGLPRTPTGHAAAVGSFCSAAVAALMEVGAHTSSLPPMQPGSAAAVSTGAPAQSMDRRSSELSASQRQLLSVVKGQLQQAGALSPQHLDAVQEVLAILRRQVMKETGSDCFEVSKVKLVLVA